MPFGYASISWPTRTFGKIEDGWNGESVCLVHICAAAVFVASASVFLVHFYVFDLEEISKPLCASVPQLSYANIVPCLHWQPI